MQHYVPNWVLSQSHSGTKDLPRTLTLLAPVFSSRQRWMSDISSLLVMSTTKMGTPTSPNSFLTRTQNGQLGFKNTTTLLSRMVLFTNSIVPDEATWPGLDEEPPIPTDTRKRTMTISDPPKKDAGMPRNYLAPSPLPAAIHLSKWRTVLQHEY